jgi:hypothetical protein
LPSGVAVAAIPLAERTRQLVCPPLCHEVNKQKAWRFAEEVIMRAGDLNTSRPQLRDRRSYFFGQGANLTHHFGMVFHSHEGRERNYVDGRKLHSLEHDTQIRTRKGHHINAFCPGAGAS